MIKSLTNDLCIMVDALMANKVISYGDTFAPDLARQYKYIQVPDINNVKMHGDCFEIEYFAPNHIRFETRCANHIIMCLINYPEYQEWMREHPDTPVHDWTNGKDKHVILQR